MRHSIWVMTWARLLSAAVVALATWPVKAQKAAKIPQSSLAHLVPAQVGIFAELHLQQKHQAQLARIPWGSLTRVLAGGSEAKSPLNLDWRGLIQRNLGLSPKTLLADLAGQRVAVAAPNWERLGEAVILMQFSSTSSVKALVAGSRAELVNKRGRVRIYRTGTDLLVATDGRLVILAQAGGADELFREVVALRTGGEGHGLAADPAFAGQVGKLHRGQSGYLYLKAGQDDNPALGEAFPKLVSAAVGLYAFPGRVDFDIRARLRANRSRARQRPIDTERMRRLPDSVLMAWAGTMDLAGSLGRLLDPGADADEQGYLELLRTILDPETLDRQVVAQLGPRVILVWDRDRGGSDLPQLTVMVESADAASAASALAEAFAALANSLAGAWDVDSVRAHVERREHLDSHMLVVDLKALLADKTDLAAGLDLMASMQPTFTALEGWVLAATHPQAIQQIIDADRGWIPRVAGIRGLGLYRRRVPERRISLAVAQPAMASAVLAWWQRRDREQAGWGLNEMLGSSKPAVGKVDRPTLGIAIKAGDRSGSAGVVRVHAHQPAIGKLKVGDEIVGLNGQPLDVDDPVADLRRRIAECPDPTRLTLRVWRADSEIDVIVPLPTEVSMPEVDAAPSADPLAALQRLQSVGQLLSQFTYAVFRSSTTQYYARASLKFVPPSTGKPSK
ncbi:MAG: hypothetical protein ACE5GE_02115 [Phycisphaerae bacterium]